MTIRLNPPPERDFPLARLQQRKEQLVSQLFAEPAARGQRHRRRTLAAIIAVAAAFTAVGAGVAAATGALPWWHSAQTMRSAMNSPFGTSADPAALPGSKLRLSLPGPASTTFEVVTKTVTVATGQAECTAIVVKDAHGQTQRLLSGCATAGAAVAQAGSSDWRAPSGLTYTIISGPTPTPTATTVALLAGNGITAATEPVSDGYYLLYAPAELPTDSLVFSNARGQVVSRLALHPHP